MTDDAELRLLEHLRHLPPDLPAPGDRMERVRSRVARRRRRTAGAAGLAVAVVAAGVTAGVAGIDRAPTPDRAPPLTCPQQPPRKGADGKMTVPAAPTVDTRGHLVPRETPTRALTCRYTRHSGTTPSWALQSYELRAGLDDLAEDLWWFPVTTDESMQVCPAVATANPVDHLLGLTYAGGGTVWISTPDPEGCRDTTNGARFSYRSAGDQIERSVAAGRWVPSQTPRDRLEPDPCTAGPETGRFGEEAAIVPPSPVELQVCQRIDTPGAKQPASFRTGTLREGVADFAAQLGSAPVQPRTSGCYAPRGVSHNYTLLFRYAEGPPVRVFVMIGCEYPVVGRLFSGNEPPGMDLAGRLAAVVAGG
jgi:hypothetical protein